MATSSVAERVKTRGMDGLISVPQGLTSSSAISCTEAFKGE
jgi:hypothetical protein